MTTDKDSGGERWLADQARDALAAIAKLHEQAVTGLKGPAGPAAGTAQQAAEDADETGWFDPATRSAESTKDSEQDPS